MTIKQKLAIAFYRTKIKSVAVVSSKKAASVAFELFCTPYSGKPTRKIPTLFNTAEKLEVSVHGIKAFGFKFLPKTSNDKTVLIAHGFDSHSYKFEHFIKPLTSIGFTVLLFDAPGHGISEGKTLHSLQYRDTIWAINKKYGLIDIIIAHSIGALASSFAIEKLPNLQKLVLIAPPENINKPLEDFTKLLKLSKKVYEALINKILHVGKVPISWFSVGRALQATTIPTLWLHDKDDKICLYKYVEPIIELQLSHVQFQITEGLGHSKIYKKKNIVQTIVAFLES